MKRQPLVLRIALLLLFATGLSLPLKADRDGMIGRSTTGCGTCHGNNATAALNVTVNQPANGIRAGQQADFSVVIAQAAQAAGGLNLAIRNAQQQNAGQINAGAGSKVVNGELTHQQPKPIAGGQVDFPFTWTAPAQHGTYTLTLAANAVNGNNRSDDGDQWRVLNAITITVAGATVSAPTGGQQYCRGQNVSLTWTQTGYTQFRVDVSADNGATWTTAAQSVGANTGSYTWTVPTQQPGSTTTVLRLVNIADGAEVARSEAFTVLAGPAIVQQPEDVDECIGGTFTLSIGVAGADNQLRWRKDGQIIPGAVNPTITIVNAKASDAGIYDVQVFGCGETISKAATVRILARPTIATQPRGVAVCEGEPALLEIAATGDKLTYQWYKNGEAIPAQTSAKLGFAATSIFDDAEYYCMVTGGCTPVLTSDTVSVSILEKPRLTGALADRTLFEGDTLALTVQAVGKELTYQWTKNGAAVVGATQATFRIASVVRADSGVYACVVKNRCDSVVTQNVQITIRPASGPGVLVLAESEATIGELALCERPVVRFADMLRNRGGSPLSITSISIDPPSVVSLVDIDLPVVIPAGESRDLSVRFAPKAVGDLRATVSMFVAGVKTDLVLRGTVIPSVKLGKDTLAFIPGIDQQSVRCNFLAPVRCENVTVTAVRISGPGASSYRLTGLPAFPIVVPKNGSMDVCMEAVGPTGGAATVTVESAEGNATFTVVRDFVASVDDGDLGVAGLAPNPAFESVDITVPHGVTSIRIMDIQGAIVCTQAVDGKPLHTWNGISDQGARVAPGVYTVVLEGAGKRRMLPLMLLR